MFPTTAVAFAAALFVSHFASAQLAPAGGGSVQVSPGEYFLFGSEGTFTYGSGFTYLNYSTKEFDSILTNLAADGTFSGLSPTTGRVVSGQISTSSIVMTYNGRTGSEPKLSAYGPTRAFAGNWLGVYSYPSQPFGFVHFGISSQGGIVAVSYLGFAVDAGVGSIDASETA